jgi:hypothetical protein
MRLNMSGTPGLSLPAVLVVLVLAGCRCDEDRLAAPTASSEPAVNAAPSPSTSTSPSAQGHAEIRRARLGDGPPATRPPKAARQGPLGVHYHLLDQGGGSEPDVASPLAIEMKAWDESDRLVTDTTKQPQPLIFFLSSLPEPLAAELGKANLGSRLQVWLPAEAGQGWKLPEWPESQAMRLELALLGTAPTAPSRQVTMGALPIEPVAEPPSATGPPGTAKRAAGGIRYAWLKSGPEGSQPAATSTVVVRYSGYGTEGVVVERIVDNQTSTLQLDKAPAGLGPILAEMVIGDSVRIWLPPDRAREVLPQVTSAAVVDVTLVDIR